MKQIIQNLETGKVRLVEVPVPIIGNGELLIQTTTSLISIGTEKMLVEFGKSGWIDKARQQPDKVKQVIQKIKNDGVTQTIKSVQSKLDTPLPMGYCNVGRVIQVGKNIDQFKVGDRVVSNGPHAECVAVTENLCARIPDNVKDEQAAFTVISSIALQGIRLANPTIGETFVVIGLGLIGLLTVQILHANGCKVIGIDINTEKLNVADELGARTINANELNDPFQSISGLTGGKGVDGVLITTSTKSNDPVHNAAQMCRKRGRIVLVGVTGIELLRSDFYEKELSFQVSCSYGPGRYDYEYEKKGNDYPIGYVRWTEQRNFDAILALLSSGNLDIGQLVTHRYHFEEAESVYKSIFYQKSVLGVIFMYNKIDDKDILIRKVRINNNASVQYKNDNPVIGLIGAGAFTSQYILPCLLRTQAILHSIASKSGVNSTHLGEKYNFQYSVTDVDEIFDNNQINTVFITTRHDTHASLVKRALENGKNVFVEKPLALNHTELDQINSVISDANSRLMIGFNRRFAPLVTRIKNMITSDASPRSYIYTINSGAIPSDHWIHDSQVGGGRIIGEVCHFIDLLRFLSDSSIQTVNSTVLSSNSIGKKLNDIITINIRFQDGSIGTIHYFSNGHKSFPKERLEIFSNGRIIQMDNFKQLKTFGWKGFNQKMTFSQDKGHYNGIKAFIDSITHGKDSPIPYDEIFEVTKCSFDIVDFIK